MRLLGDTARRRAGALLMLVLAALVWAMLVLLWAEAAERAVPPVFAAPSELGAR